MRIKEFFTKKNVVIISSIAAACVLAAIAGVLVIKNISEGKPTAAPISSELTSIPDLSSEVSYVPQGIMLNITSHSSKDTTTTEPITVFTGTSDPAYPLMLNGVEVERDESGAFSIEKELSVGKNNFTFSHKDVHTTYVVRYRYVVMNWYSPSGNQKYKSGSSFAVVATARDGSNVTATFQGKTITLTKASAQGGDEELSKSDTFVTYTGSFSLPSDNTQDLDLGKVKFTATYNGVTESFSSGKIVCLKAEIPVVAEIVSFSAETFDGNTSDDDSRPTNNYLPQGTVDYVVGRAYYGDKEYLKLRCGRRVYVSKKLTPGNSTVTVAKEYAAVLPDTNTLSVASVDVTDRFTTLTLNTAWKAPFLLDLLPQNYTNPSTQDYTVSAVTCQYVDIQFCYASDLSGEISFAQYHPLFTRAEIIKGSGSCTLRLFLRRTGGFYGWDASYNASGQLVFKFLHPAQVTTANNAYGVDLSGVKIMIDVGHGGADCGAVGLSSSNPESERNLYLATKLKAELESIGATVILNRSGDTTLNTDERCQLLKQVKPDLCIAIHHDSSTSSRPNGFGAFHSTLFSREAARYIFEETMAANIYNSAAQNNRNRFAWHYYFVARMSDCPVVLTENGFMSSQIDHAGIMSDSVNLQKAQAMVRGVARYFLSLKLDKVVITPEPETPPQPEIPPVTPPDNDPSEPSSPESGNESEEEPNNPSEPETPSDSSMPGDSSDSIDEDSSDETSASQPQT